MIDLHTHSNVSDGILSPKDLILYAKSRGVKAIALTDHDTIKGLKEAREIAIENEIEFVNGIEFSAEFNKYSEELHIIGLFFDLNNEDFINFCSKMIEYRLARNNQLLNFLNEKGIDIKKEELLQDNPYFENIGKPNFARLLVKKGVAKNVFEAFNNYLSNEKLRNFVHRVKFKESEIIDVIHKARGIAILAHPDQLGINDKDELIAFIKDLKDKGLDGIEVYYTGYTKKDIKFYKNIAKKFNLLLSGGSDFHGPDTRLNVEIGKYGKNKPIPFSILDKMKYSLML